MDRNHLHPLIATGSLLSGVGALIGQYGPTLLGFALTLVGLWLDRRENRRHERALAEIQSGRPPYLPAEACADSPE